jgi:hypothetical protein
MPQNLCKALEKQIETCYNKFNQSAHFTAEINKLEVYHGKTESSSGHSKSKQRYFWNQERMIKIRGIVENN